MSTVVYLIKLIILLDTHGDEGFVAVLQEIEAKHDTQ